MKTLLLTLPICFLGLHLKAQNICNLIENHDPTLTKVSYQTVFVTVVDGKDKFNIKFWKFADKFSISCFVVTKDTFCINTASAVSFDFEDGSKFNFVSDKKQNCRGELNKDFKEGTLPDQNSPLWLKKVSAVHVAGTNSTKSFTVEDNIAERIQAAFRCIVDKKIL